MAILKKVLNKDITKGAKKHLEDTSKEYGDRTVKTAKLPDGVATSDREFNRFSFISKAMKHGGEEVHTVRYVRKGNSISVIHLDRE